MRDGAPVVQVAGGSVSGLRLGAGDVVSFLGVPYAAPPFGPHRMRPPRPVEPWTGVRPARQFGPTVPKNRMAPHFEQMFPERWIDGEDCLNLNIWSPGLEGDPAPVLVWLHGGGFTNGSGSTRELDGTAFARDGIVCVTLNYRLGADGFLFFDDGVANCGLLDQLAALTWVRDNIAGFGGDPTRVTLAGHSAGGSAVACLLSTPRSQGLFTRAISMSTSGVQRCTSPSMALRAAQDLAERLGVAPSRDAVAEAPTDAILRAMSDQQRELEDPDVAKWGAEARTMAPWVPTADGELLAPVPLQAIAGGQGGDVPLLTGTARDELRLHFTPDYLDTVRAAALAASVERFGLDDAGLDPYRANRPGASPGDLLAAVATDWYFRMPMVRLAESRTGASTTAPTWVYRLDRPRTEDNDGYGAAHAVDLPFVFDTLDVAETRPRIGPHPSHAVADLVHGTWTDFVKGQDPPWDPYDLGSRTTALLTESLDVVPDPDGSERVSWSQFS